jgi:hypothetical protein
MWDGLRGEEAERLRERVLKSVEVGRFEGKSATSRFSIKNEGLLIDGARF